MIDPLNIAIDALRLLVSISAPFLLAVALTALGTAFLQATTQLQEPTLTLVPRLAAFILASIIAGPWAARNIIEFTQTLFALIPSVGL